MSLLLDNSANIFLEKYSHTHNQMLLAHFLLLLFIPYSATWMNSGFIYLITVAGKNILRPSPRKLLQSFSVFTAYCRNSSQFSEEAACLQWWTCITHAFMLPELDGPLWEFPTALWILGVP